MTDVIGVDLGGTNLRVAAFRGLDDGVTEPLASVRQPVGDEREVDAVIEAIAVAVAQVGGDPRVPVGVGLAAMLSDRRGTVASAPNLGWRNVSFGPRLAARLGRRVGVYNDVNAAAFGELGLGAGRGARDLLAVFVGTGLGAGVIADGRLIEGATNCAGELGHVKVAWGPDAAPCNCGGRGCIEAYVGGVHLLAAIQRETGRELLPSDVDAAAGTGVAWAVALWDRLAVLLAVAIGNAVTVLNCDRLVLGGGVLGRAPELRARTVAAMATLVPPALWAPLTIVDAALDDDAGLLGAALLAARGVSLL